MMDVLVTGGGGFLGMAIVRKALARGWRVRSYSRGVYPDLAALGVEHIKGDLSNRALLSDAMKRCDVVFHAAAKPGVWGDYSEYHHVNVLGTENVIAACRERGVGKLVFTSSPSVVFNGKDQENIDESAPYPAHFLSYYSKTKAISERLVLAANDRGLATVSLRPRLIWGPDDPNVLPRLLKLAQEQRLRLIDHGRHVIDHTYVDNAAEAHLLAAEHLLSGAAIAGKIYFISNGEPIPASDFVNHLLAACGVSPVRASMPRVVGLGVAGLCEGLWKILGRQDDPPMTRYVLLSMGATNWFDISAARRDLGYTPAISNEEGFQRLAAWYRPAR